MVEAGFFTAYAWLIPAFAVVAFTSIAAFGHRTPEKGGWIALVLIALAGLFSVGVFGEAVGTPRPTFGAEAHVQEWNWWSVGELDLNVGIYVDNLTAFMLFVVGILVTLILLYSLGYMHDEGDARRRYYFEMTLFITGMLGMVVASNYLMAFLFWEIMGLCSYLLIGYWFQKPSAAAAAKKAFLTTRIGDAFLLVGLGILFVEYGTLDFDNLFAMALAPGAEGTTALLVANFCIFMGAVGKSAQFPLHVWLPDAMEGPTTVSALIHAATMVKAGVYLVARSLPLFLLTPSLLYVVAIVGAFTALFAASIALVNNDLKRVLAYSTLSQLGYMFAALGLAGVAMHGGHEELAALAFIVAIFHLFSHAFFKAALFLGAGSVGHAVHTYDMRLMGGLRKYMPVTGPVMLLSTMSIAGVPFFSGFFSKDEILAKAFEAAAGDPFYWVVYGFLLVTAGMTAYYMFRLYFMTFSGKWRAEPHAAAHGAGHAHGASHDAHGHGHAAKPHEGPWSMKLVLIVLNIFAVMGAIVMFFVLPGGVEGFLHPELPGEFATPHHEVDAITALFAPFTHVETYITLALVIAGIGLAFAWWNGDKTARSMKTDEAYRGLGKAAYRRWYFDDAYNWFAMNVVVGFARFEAWFDANVIDGVVDGVGQFSAWWAERMRKWTSGNIQDYALTMLAGFVAIVLVVIYAPQLTAVIDALRGGI